ncbi:hypothetical protein [Desulfomonile tiedjei]|uniref:Uncharacterized protein n=1 Tax=Desulfomonile tiedjei (strain ATCC 49306 / DSM 6799 / DCB-1) TaxID=706587 RepID=I4C945_DESTA|nr:hypothetical protein [Desulfomonile tiedjei]AFM26086.1 hypothetical protein Desti_3434 [Desulfomonile tiedjei DSM 6799]
MLKKPKTIEEWGKERLRKAKQEKGFVLIPMELWNGEAFHALEKSEKLILLECLSQLRYAPKSEKKRKKIPKDTLFQCGLGWLLNGGEFGLPTKYLQERGIKGEDTIARAKRKLVQVGFMDVVTQGSFRKAGRFRYSDRWRIYNGSALMSEHGEPLYDGPLPGYCHYPNIVKRNVANSRSETTSLDVHEADTLGYVQLDLFTDYAGCSANE